MIEGEHASLANSLWTATAAANRKNTRGENTRGENTCGKTGIPVTTQLQGSIYTDIAIIGGGFSGLSTALHAAEAGLRVVLLEARTLGWGASGRNGGQVIPGLKELPETIIRRFGPLMGSRMIGLAGSAPALVFDLIRRHGIECDAEQRGWVQPSVGKRGIAINRELVRQWQHYDAPVTFHDAAATAAIIGSDLYIGAAEDSRGGKLHPLKYAFGLATAAMAKGAGIYTDSAVEAVTRTTQGWQLRTAAGEVRAERLVLATNAYGRATSQTANSHVIPVQSVQVATRPLSDNLLATILPGGQVVSDTLRLLKYFRLDAEGRLLMGGRGSTTRIGTLQQMQGLRALVRRMYPALADTPFEYAWGGNVALTLDHFPKLCEPYGPADRPGGMITLAGYNGRGIALTTALGRVVAQRLDGAAPDSLDFPVTRLQPVPMRWARNLAIPVAALINNILDRRDISEGGSGR